MYLNGSDTTLRWLYACIWHYKQDFNYTQQKIILSHQLKVVGSEWIAINDVIAIDRVLPIVASGKWFFLVNNEWAFRKRKWSGVVNSKVETSHSIVAHRLRAFRKNGTTQSLNGSSPPPFGIFNVIRSLHTISFIPTQWLQSVTETMDSEVKSRFWIDWDELICSSDLFSVLR